MTQPINLVVYACVYAHILAAAPIASKAKPGSLCAPHRVDRSVGSLVLLLSCCFQPSRTGTAWVAARGLAGNTWADPSKCRNNAHQLWPSHGAEGLHFSAFNLSSDKKLV